MERNQVVIIDDASLDRQILGEVFSGSYKPVLFDNAFSAIEYLKEHVDQVCVMLFDLVMPQMDGFEFISQVKSYGWDKKIPLVVITSEESAEVFADIYEQGVSDIVHKPYDFHVIRRRIQNVIDLFQSKNKLEEQKESQILCLQRQNKHLNDGNHKLIAMLSTIVEFRNLESGTHIERVKEFTRILLNELTSLPEFSKLNSDQINMISYASALHDVGKIAIPDEILLKPGKLTPEEFKVIKTHTIRGCEIIDKFRTDADKEYYHTCYEICKYHHERYDGNGYPEGIKGEEIPITAQVVALADVYDALVSKRVYKEPYSFEDAVQMIINGECGVFSPKIIACFLSCRRKFEAVARALNYIDGKNQKILQNKK